MNTATNAYKYSKEETNFNKSFYHKQQYLNKGYRRAKIIKVEEDTSSCPRCQSETTTDHHRAETYCKECGLIVSATIEYTGLRRVYYEYGRK